MSDNPRELPLGSWVRLRYLPPGLLDGLPAEDQRAISKMVGARVRLVSYDADGRAELEFVDDVGDNHTIWVPHGSIGPIEPSV